VANYQGWEKSHFSPDVGLFWQNGHDEGMEFNINSRQTQDILRGGPGYRPSMNAYMYADALAIAHVAKLAGKAAVRAEYEAKAAKLKENVQKLLWDPKREFFLHRFKQDETSKAGDKVAAMTLTYESGKFAGSPHGREEIGYVPWQFNLPAGGKGFEAAWRFLMDPQFFFAPYGPTVTERNDPQFLVTNHCCWWSGQSWPYATTQTLVACANLLNNYKQDVFTRADYFKLLKVYTLTQRKDGKPYIAEGVNPDTGSWEGYDSPGHSNHYFHSGYNDLIVTGLAGLRPRADDTIEINPLVPEDWAYFCLDDVGYRGHRVSVVWDKAGDRYKLGAGLHLIVDGKDVASSPTLSKLTAPLSPHAPLSPIAKNAPRRINYAANNDGTRFPRAIASHTSPRSNLSKLIDGQYWYTVEAPNRWTAEGSATDTDWAGVDFGISRKIDAVTLYPLDDPKTIKTPIRITLEYWSDNAWKSIPGVTAKLPAITGHRANEYTFPEIQSDKLRAVLTHAPGAKSGLSEFEAWGTGTLPVEQSASPKGNLALNESGQGFPKATASVTSRFDKIAEVNDGKIQFLPNPRNRWTSYESPNTTDWVQIDFGAEKTVARATLSFFDDNGGVRAPADYTIESFDGQAFHPCENQKNDPAKPAGNAPNECTFTPIKTTKIRVTFTHTGASRTGLTELELWER
jgi:hypothetical protein